MTSACNAFFSRRGLISHGRHRRRRRLVTLVSVVEVGLSVTARLELLTAARAWRLFVALLNVFGQQLLRVESPRTLLALPDFPLLLSVRLLPVKQQL